MSGNEEYWIKRFREEIAYNINSNRFSTVETIHNGIIIETFADIGRENFAKRTKEIEKIGEETCNEVNKLGIKCTPIVDGDTINRLIFLRFKIEKNVNTELPNSESVADIFNQITIDR